MDIIIPIIFGVGLVCCVIFIGILVVQDYKNLKKLKKQKDDKEDIIEALKWYRDEYVSPKQFSSTEIDLDTPARKALCTMLIDFLEKGKHIEIVDKHQEKFFYLIKAAKAQREYEGK